MDIDESLDDQAAQELFPHTKTCTERLRLIKVTHGSVVCTCHQGSRRKSFIGLLRKVRVLSYVDAYAKIRHEAKKPAEKAITPQERLAFEEMASWAEELEWKLLQE